MSALLLLLLLVLRCLSRRGADFLYFQLPLKSRAVPVFHGASFIGAHVIPICYSFLLFCNPTVRKQGSLIADPTAFLWITHLLLLLLCVPR